MMMMMMKWQIKTTLSSLGHRNSIHNNNNIVERLLQQQRTLLKFPCNFNSNIDRNYFSFSFNFLPYKQQPFRLILHKNNTFNIYYNNSSAVKRKMSSNRKVSSDMNAFQDYFNRASKIVALTGAGISAESGIPTFRGEGGFWRSHKSEELATPEAFAKNPGLVWQFYEYRRQLVSSKEPNLAHKALAVLEQNFLRDSPQRQVIVVTQNVDELHRRAGMKRVLELHGSLFKTRCTQCKAVKTNYSNPIVPALEKIELDGPDRQIDPKDLPRCEKCTGLLRPHVVWFGEQLDPFVLKQAEGLMSVTDFLLVIGTSSIVYPAASLVPQAAKRGVVISEFNLEQTAASDYAKFFFKGPCAQTLPKALQIGETMISHWG